METSPLPHCYYRRRPPDSSDGMLSWQKNKVCWNSLKVYYEIKFSHKKMKIWTECPTKILYSIMKFAPSIENHSLTRYEYQSILIFSKEAIIVVLSWSQSWRGYSIITIEINSLLVITFTVITEVIEYEITTFVLSINIIKVI